MSSQQYDALFKVLITGNSGVGKSALLTRYTVNIYDEEYLPTIGLDFKVKTVDIKGKRVKLQVWDTGGQERFRTITTSYYRGCHAVLLVYDVTDQESFVRLRDWLREVDVYARADVIKVLVGNKSDQSENREVDLSTAQTFAAEEGVELIEVSAKTGDNVEELFTTTSSKLFDTFFADQPAKSTIRLESGSRRRQGGCSLV